MPSRSRREPREMRLVSEWCAGAYPERRISTNVRLGDLHPRLNGQFLSESEQRMVGVFRRWADAIVWMPDHLVLIEAAILPNPGDLGVLAVYERLIPRTAELGPERLSPVEKVLLAAVPDNMIRTLAVEQGIRYETYAPAWVVEYLEKLRPRDRTEGLTAL